jgi:hypothetical protein
MNTPPTWSNSSIHDEIRESGLDCVNRPTPETDASKRPSGLRSCADGLDANPDKDFAQKCMRNAADRMEQLQCQLGEARETIATMEIRHAAVMLHTQSIVDEANQCRERRDSLSNILKECLHAMPCGYVPNHTVENLPAMITDQAQMLGEECNRADALEEQLDKLTDACRNLIDAKGRHNTMIAFNKMKDVFQSLKTKEL